MWLLENKTAGNVFILFREKVKYTVGRVGADLLLNGDNSISRSHAFLHFQLLNEDKDEETESIELEDAGSKFGVFHNDGIPQKIPLPKGKRIVLKDGDRIRFGLLQNIWTVSHQPLVSMVSSLSPQQATQFEQHLRVLGGKLSPKWSSECTHLTMGEASVTVKVLHALLEPIPIVTCDYWRDLIQAARRGRTALPQPGAYLPRLSETLMQKQDLDLCCRVERQKLFAGMTFVFLHRQHLDTYSSIVQKAGGHCKDLKAGVQRAFMLKENVVVIQYIPSTESQSSQTINTIEDFLHSNSRRIIPEYEIGLAIVHCSTKKYCNPCYKFVDDLMPLSNPQTSQRDQDSLLVENTRPNTNSHMNMEKTVVFVPDSEHFDSIPNADTSASTSAANNAVLMNSDSDDELLCSVLKATQAIEDGNSGKRKRVGNKAIVSSDEEEREKEQKRAKKDHIETPSNAKNAVSAEKTLKKGVSSTESSTTTHNEQQGKTPQSKAKPTLIKSRIEPLPVITHQRGNRVVNISGFLEKSQAPVKHASNSPNKTEDASNANGGVKRPRIAVIDDDDDDDLFCFGGDNKSSLTQNAKRSRVIDSDEELFEFAEQSNHMIGDGNVNDTDQSLESRQPCMSKENSKTKSSTHSKPKPKKLPQKINIENWLCCVLDGTKLNAESVKSDLSSAKIEDEETKQWIDSLKGGFQVHMRNVTIPEPQKSIAGVGTEESTSGESTINCKNFKKFVKTRHPYHSRSRSDRVVCH